MIMQIEHWTANSEFIVLIQTRMQKESDEVRMGLVVERPRGCDARTCAAEDRTGYYRGRQSDLAWHYALWRDRCRRPIRHAQCAVHSLSSGRQRKHCAAKQPGISDRSHAQQHGPVESGAAGHRAPER